MVVLSTVPNIAPAASLIIRTIVLARVLGSDKKNYKKKKRIGSINPLSQQQLFCVQETRYTTSLHNNNNCNHKTYNVWVWSTS